MIIITHQKVMAYGHTYYMPLPTLTQTHTQKVNFVVVSTMSKKKCETEWLNQEESEQSKRSHSSPGGCLDESTGCWLHLSNLGYSFGWSQHVSSCLYVCKLWPARTLTPFILSTATYFGHDGKSFNQLIFKLHNKQQVSLLVFYDMCVCLYSNLC